MLSKRNIVTIILMAGVSAGSASAQEGEAKQNMVFRDLQPPGPDVAVRTFQFVSPEAMIPGKVIKGAPYSATAITETVQTLPDGNRITDKISSFLARDSEGRTRREQSLPAIGPWASEGPAPKMITISDPVSGSTYMLDENTKIARKLATVEPLGAGMADKVRYERMFHVEGQSTAP